MTTTLHLSLAEYDSMVRVGAFDQIDRKVELIRGELIQMNLAGPLHDDLITYLTNWSARGVDPAVSLITSQTGLDLPETQSRPEPDLLWLRAARYRDAHPRASDVQLAIEVAFSSLAYELETKRRLYAESNIVEYWIVDAQAQCVHVHRHPVQGDYQDRSVSTRNDILSPLIQPSAKLELNDLFLG
ncbi:Uma2 family endonuclease [Rhodopirellula halodulae]|uniref:Uma2 family endonuclease n=1 Tax=Rhodopirellula halodulae TaxID=2894198 RepID=UPI001E4BDB57|nr:Uma2 family endonuclease [Rhodopirellula sp. JC737]MCC9656075.1 Uma2 family endonuclease [Rhodopirellula sp. JC737]